MTRKVQKYEFPTSTGMGRKIVDEAVTNVVSTLLLLSISVALFVPLYYMTFTVLAPSPQPPSFNAVATISGDDLVILHIGGESIDTDARIMVKGDGVSVEGKIGDYLDSASAENGLWDTGEELKLTIGSSGRVVVTIIDTHSNKVVLRLDMEI